MKSISILAIGMMLCAGSLFCADAAAFAPGVRDEDNARFGWADVLRVDPVYEDAPAGDQPRAAATVLRGTGAGAHAGRRAEDDRGKRTGGGVLGAIVGGILGNKVGKGDGRKLATVGGAVAGAVVGSNVARRIRATATSRDRRKSIQSNVVAPARDQRHRATSPHTTSNIAIAETSIRARLDYDPGDRIRVQGRTSRRPTEFARICCARRNLRANVRCMSLASAPHKISDQRPHGRRHDLARAPTGIDNPAG